VGRPESDSDNALSGLINKARSRKAGVKDAPKSEQPETTPKPSGLKPSEILYLPPDQKKLVGYLSRQRHASFKQMQQALDMDPTQILQTLATLKDRGYINEALQDAEIFYRVKFVDTSKRVGSILPKELQDALNQDNATFLSQSPLFKELTDAEINHIQQSITQEHYERSDVILWQGEPAKAFCMIKNGVVAVTNVSSDGKSNLITYLEQGDFFGESSLLTGATTNATITAFTPADVVIINKEDFIHLIAGHSGRSLELAKILAYRLASTNARMANKQNDVRLFFVISAGAHVGATTVASALALTIAASTKAATAYIEYPKEETPANFGFSPGLKEFAHPGNFHILNPSAGSSLSEAAQIHLLMDQANERFRNIVICIKRELAPELESLIRNAAQIAVISSRTSESRQNAKQIIDTLKYQMQVNKTKLLTVVNQTVSETDAREPNQDTIPDFILPYLTDLPTVSEQRAENLPVFLRKITEEMVSRLGFTSQIGVYIPTTIATNQETDTSVQVNNTLAFMGKIFGGATHEEVHGVWNSTDVGLVNETIHLVRSFCTQTILDERMGSVIDYVEGMKKELQQEAMAIEVNQKLMLI